MKALQKRDIAQAGIYFFNYYLCVSALPNTIDGTLNEAFVLVFTTRTFDRKQYPILDCFGPVRLRAGGSPMLFCQSFLFSSSPPWIRNLARVPQWLHRISMQISLKPEPSI